MGERVSLAPGRQVTPTLRLIEPLGAGGMGAVWLADHQKLKTRVVVKFMLGGLDSSESAKRRFEREASAAAQVKSPHVVTMHDHGVTEEGVPYIVMEHLEGKDLGGWIRDRGALDALDVIAIIVQVAKALTKVHAAGLLHRDIKPDNIFLVEGEEDLFVKLLDFGIAKAHTPEHGEDGTLDGGTKTGQVVGTPFYMSPEQVTAQKSIDLRSDLWSLGVVTFEALTGTRPFDGPSFGALAVKIATGSPPKPSEVRSALPPSFDDWFAKACARDPKDRFATAKEMADALRVVFEGVVSLPSPSLLGDSGPRGPLSSSSGSKTPPERLLDSSSGSGPRSADPKAETNPDPKSHPPSPTFGLASTIKDNPEHHAALGKSESSTADAPPPKSWTRIGLVAAATVAVGVAAFALNASKEKPSGNPTHVVASPHTVTSAAAKSVAPPASSTPAIASTPSAPVSAASVAPPVVDAGKTTPPKPTGNGVTTAKPTVTAKPTETPTAPPTKPTTAPTKPASTEPDLF